MRLTVRLISFYFIASSSTRRHPMKTQITTLALAVLSFVALTACSSQGTARTNPKHQPAIAASRSQQQQTSSLMPIAEGPRGSSGASWGGGFGPY
jgi:hypothetical protein